MTSDFFGSPRSESVTYVGGAAKSLFTLRTWWAAGLEMTAAGVIVGGATYVLGLILKVSG